MSTPCNTAAHESPQPDSQAPHVCPRRGHRRRRRRRRVVATACAVAAAAVAALDARGGFPVFTVSSVWNGGNGNWSTVTNWTPPTFFPNNGNGGSNWDATI